MAASSRYRYPLYLSLAAFVNVIVMAVASPFPLGGFPRVEPWAVMRLLLFLTLDYAWDQWHERKIEPWVFHCRRRPVAYQDSLWTLSRYPVKAAIVYLCIRLFQPLLRNNCFHFSLDGDFLLPCLSFPLLYLQNVINYNLVCRPQRDPSPSLRHAIWFRRYRAALLELVSSAVCAPLCEEIIYRGFLIPSLSGFMPLSLSVALSSAAFAWIHQDLSTVLSDVSFGVVNGVVFTRSGNLLPPVFFHMLWNTACFIRYTRKCIGDFSFTLFLKIVIAITIASFSFVFSPGTGFNLILLSSYPPRFLGERNEDEKRRSSFTVHRASICYGTRNRSISSSALVSRPSASSQAFEA